MLGGSQMHRGADRADQTQPVADDLIPREILNRRHVNGEDEFLVLWSDAKVQPMWVPASRLLDHWGLVRAWESQHAIVEVQSILNRRIYEGHVMYLIRWADGVPDTWEPRENLLGAHYLADMFEREAAHDIKGARMREQDGVPSLWVNVQWVMPDKTSHATWTPFLHLPGGHALLRRWAERNPTAAAELPIEGLLREQSPEYRRRDARTAGSASAGSADSNANDGDDDDDRAEGVVALSELELGNLMAAVREVGSDAIDWDQVALRVGRRAIECQIYWDDNKKLLTEPVAMSNVVAAGPPKIQRADLTVLETIEVMSKKEVLDFLRRRGVSDVKPANNDKQLRQRLRQHIANQNAFTADEQRHCREAFLKYGLDYEVVQQQMELQGFKRLALEIQNYIVAVMAPADPAVASVLDGGVKDQALRAGPHELAAAPEVAANMSFSPETIPGRPVSQRVGGSPVPEFKTPDTKGRAEGDVPTGTAPIAGKLRAECPKRLLARRVAGGVLEYECAWNERGTRGRWMSISDLTANYGDSIVRLVELWDDVNDVEFDVQAIVDDRLARRLGEPPEYKVQWVLYPDRFNRWESEEHLGDRVTMVNEYLKRKKNNDGSGWLRNPVGPWEDDVAPASGGAPNSSGGAAKTVSTTAPLQVASPTMTTPLSAPSVFIKGPSMNTKASARVTEPVKKGKSKAAVDEDLVVVDEDDDEYDAGVVDDEDDEELVDHKDSDFAVVPSASGRKNSARGAPTPPSLAGQDVRCEFCPTRVFKSARGKVLHMRKMHAGATAKRERSATEVAAELVVEGARETTEKSSGKAATSTSSGGGGNSSSGSGSGSGAPTPAKKAKVGKGAAVAVAPASVVAAPVATPSPPSPARVSAASAKRAAAAKAASAAAQLEELKERAAELIEWVHVAADLERIVSDSSVVPALERKHAKIVRNMRKALQQPDDFDVLHPWLKMAVGKVARLVKGSDWGKATLWSLFACRLLAVATFKLAQWKQDKHSSADDVEKWLDKLEEVAGKIGPEQQRLGKSLQSALSACRQSVKQ